MKKLTAEVARQDLKHLKAWVETCDLSMKEERYMQALEIALPILEQQGRGEGDWIEWSGGDCPVGDRTAVEVKTSVQQIYSGVAMQFLWHHDRKDSAWDIIAYRIIDTNQNGE